jgi:putative peptidoglycan lipid II flippase
MARKLFGEGALTAAFVPVFRGEMEAESVEKARRLARAVMSMALLMLGAIVALSMTGITYTIGARPWGMDPDGETYHRTLLILRLTRILLPYMIFICGAAFGMGVLNAMGRFAAAGFMPALLNVFWIGSLVYLSFCGDMGLNERVQRVAVAILIAGAVQMAFMFWCMKRRGISPGFTFRGWRDEKTLLVWKNTCIAAVGAGAVQINYMLDQVLGQIAAPWAAGVIGYAERLMDLPLGVIGVAFGTVLLPTFAGLFAKGDVDGAREAFVVSSRQMLFVMVPAAVGLGVLAPDVTTVIYRGGAFDSAAVVRVSRAVAVYAVGLCFFGLQKSLVPWFQAQNDMKTPLRISVYTVCLNAALNVLAVACLPVEWRHVGLAASTVLCSGCGCVMLAAAARRRNGSLGIRRLVSPVAKMLAGSALMAAAIFGAKALVGLPPVFSLALSVGVGGAVYFAAMAAMGLRWRRRK